MRWHYTKTRGEMQAAGGARAWAVALVTPLLWEHAQLFEH